MLREIAAGTGNAGVVGPGRMEFHIANAEHKLFAVKAVAAAGQMIQRGINVVERPLTAFDQPPEIRRRQRIGDDIGTRLVFFFAQILGIGA